MKISVAGGFDFVAAWLAVEKAQPAVGGCETWKHGERGFKGEESAFSVSQPGQGNAQIEVTERGEMLQSHGNQSLRCGFFMAALPEVNDRQTNVRFWTVTV